jgi:hypothetical protein
MWLGLIGGSISLSAKVTYVEKPNVLTLLAVFFLLTTT